MFDQLLGARLADLSRNKTKDLRVNFSLSFLYLLLVIKITRFIRDRRPEFYEALQLRSTTNSLKESDETNVDRPTCETG